MSFFASPNSIRVVRGDGTTAFDTAYKMPAITDVLVGSVSVPFISGTNGVGSYTLGTCNPSATFCFGTAILTRTPGQPQTTRDPNWYNARQSFSGSLFTSLYIGVFNVGTNNTKTVMNYGVSTTHVEVSGGVVTLKDIYNHDVPYRGANGFSFTGRIRASAHGGYTIQYKLYIGRFV